MSDTAGPPASNPQGLSSESTSADRGVTTGEGAGDVIDRYELVEPLGEGGMGTVWLAQQSEPVRRLVALKIVKLGMDTREVLLRFEAERQALALMDHPHVAKVLDGGATASGRPYFVMDHVKGAPITEYCDEHELCLDERLDLFAKVCEAIQHAHLKGIIHRDIKPSNVLVALQAGVAAPIVIDFGIAKATAGGLTQQTLMTGAAQILGTPEYMPPEQATFSAADVDTRADIYSLGVLLYELLTGTKPFELGEVVSFGYTELLRTIREVVPERPSTRVSTHGAQALELALQRGASTVELRKRLHGDLDWIVMKALEKERERRYSTASEFAADVQRYRNHEPVVAAPPSARYRMAKFVRRRRKTVALLTGFSMLFVAGSIGTGVGLVRTMRANTALDLALLQKGEALIQKDEALREEERQRGLAQDNEARARLAKEDALEEADRAWRAEEESAQRTLELQQVADFQSDQLSSIDLALMGSRLRAALQTAAPQEKFAQLSSTLSKINFTDLATHSVELNIFAPAIQDIDRQFAEQPLVRAQLLESVGQALQSSGRRESALDPRTRVVELRRAVLGDEHEHTLQSISSLAYLQQKLGLIPEARAHYREALEGFRSLFGNESKDVVIVLHNQSLLANGQSQFAKAEALLREALDIAKRVLEEDAIEFVNLNISMGRALQVQGKGAEAEPYLARSLELSRRVLGDRDRQTLMAIHSMGELHVDLGQTATGIGYFLEALEGRRLILGADHVHTLASASQLGFALRLQGKPVEAEIYLREVLEGTRRSLGPEHPHSLSSLTSLGAVLETLGEIEESEACFREALEAQRRILGNHHDSALITSSALGSLLVNQGQREEAELLLWTALEGYRGLFGSEHSRSRRVLEKLDDLLRKELDAVRAEGNEQRTGLVLARLGKVALERGDALVAEPLLVEALELLDGTLPEGDPRTWTLMSDLGAAVAAQVRFTEAAPLLVLSAEELMALPSNTPPPALGATDTATAIERVVALYATWHTSVPSDGHSEEANQWRTLQATWSSSQALPTKD
jgi:serine/threonine protein kinase